MVQTRPAAPRISPRAKAKSESRTTTTMMTYRQTLLFVAVLACSLFAVRAENRKLMQTADDVVAAFQEAFGDTAADFAVGELMPEGGFLGTLSDLPWIGGIFSGGIEGLFEEGGQQFVARVFTPNFVSAVTGK